MASFLQRRFSQFLREQRGEASYGLFASRLGISKPTVYALEKGARAPSFDMIEKIQRKLKVSLADIFGETTHHVPSHGTAKPMKRGASTL